MERRIKDIQIVEVQLNPLFTVIVNFIKEINSLIEKKYERDGHIVKTDTTIRQVMILYED